MKKLVLVTGLVAALIGGVPFSAMAAKPAVETKVKGEIVEKTGTIEVKQAEKNEKYNTVTLKADPSMENFDQIKKGDQIVATYIESMAVFVAKAGEKPVTGEVEVVKAAPKGDKPSIIAVDTVQETLAVVGIDQRLAGGQREQDQCEFAGLRQQRTTFYRIARAQSERAQQQGDQQRLQRHQGERECEQGRPIGKYAITVDRHAHTHEEQSEQDAPKRLDVGDHLVAERGIGEQHTGKERAKRQ